jgi:hypothetical protein
MESCGFRIQKRKRETPQQKSTNAMIHGHRKVNKEGFLNVFHGRGKWGKNAIA